MSESPVPCGIDAGHSVIFSFKVPLLSLSRIASLIYEVSLICLIRDINAWACLEPSWQGQGSGVGGV